MDGLASHRVIGRILISYLLIQDFADDIPTLRVEIVKGTDTRETPKFH